MLFGLRNLSEEKLRKFLTDKIDYCVIYSINEDDLKFDNENENKDDKDERDTKDFQSNNGAIISFFILFNHIFNVA